MITDKETDFLYLSGILRKKKYRPFLKRLKSVLRQHKIKYGFLEGTRDIWCRDYMPIQVSKNRFVQFKYEPSYLYSSTTYRKTITYAVPVCRSIGIRPVISKIAIDGGNVIRAKKSAIMTVRVFEENPFTKDDQLLSKIKSQLKIENLVIIPQDPHDIYGHADGMVRFIDDKTVLVNDYYEEDPEFARLMYPALSDAGLDIRVLSFHGKSWLKRTWQYINYLQIGDIVIMPTVGQPEDEVAYEQFAVIFKDCEIVKLKCKEIVKYGGALNCISWNISR